MDTPDRSQIGTPLSKFEDSPVFNYINNLSPIKLDKSVHITQSFPSLSFVASLPAVFTSPHVSSHKESRFLRRHHLSDLSKPEFSSDDGDEGKTSLGVSDALHQPGSSADTQERCDLGSSMEEFNIDPYNKRSKLANKPPRTLQYDCGSPKGNATPFYGGIKTDLEMEVSATPASLTRLVQKGPEEGEKHSLQIELELQGRCQDEQSKEEVLGYDWENLIADADGEILIFDSSADQSEAFRGPDKKVADHNANDFASRVPKLPHDKTEDVHKVQSVGSLCSSYQHRLQDPAVHPEEVREQNETDHTPQLLPSTFQNKQGTGDLSDKMDDRSRDSIPFGFKDETQQQRGMRRRCLVFEMTGAKKKISEDDSKSSSSNLVQSEGRFPSGDKQLAPLKPGIGSCKLPGIGLHLNALATTSKDCRMVKHETLASGSQLISMPNSVGSFCSVTTGQKSLDNSLAPNSVERDLGLLGNELQVMQGSQQTPTFGVGEEFNQGSPKKKRCRLENAGESEACKRCNCKKSKCLKLYCECFAAGVYCVEPCSCQECFNKPIHEDTVLATRKQIESRNPLAFAPKVIRSSESVPDIGDEGNNTPASARHKRGCNCKKSSCLKKYCECYQGGVGCSSNCRCEGCKNAFGRKDGYAPPVIEEAEPEEEESEAGEKDEPDETLQITEAQKDEKKYLDSMLAITPIHLSRSSVELSFFSGRKPPRCPVVAVGSSTCLSTCETLRKSDFLQPQLKFEKKLQIISEDETPEILRGSSSPVSGVKTTSPNRKRVSPPHNEFGSSPGQRSGRKLILQSIPPFPSLTHDGTIFR
ncbi:protein tesmin/TSO1-like CXC 3 isoform X2 [Magnolia sinica]|uniref:protein tesmin/TSO1-like CXC 3 isoform X2 n=1 Tax=Magnolia sinica TaxID=86752 RepID=UPI002659AFB9|nr:protein tesmin/TSO1-like CXC 3 isoform X2 [Magnolia sinica]